jgi:hypothetical protein
MDESNKFKTFLGSAKEFLAPLREYLRRVFHHAVSTILSVIGGVLGFASLIAAPSAKHRPFLRPQIWIPLLIGGFVIAQFLAFLDVRRERNALQHDMNRRFNNVKHRFELSNVTGKSRIRRVAGTPDQPGYQFFAHFLNGGDEVLKYEIERFEIELDGHARVAVETRMANDGYILPGRTKNVDFWVDTELNEVVAGTCDLVARYSHSSGGREFRSTQSFRIGWEFEPIPTGTPVPPPTMLWFPTGAPRHDDISGS